jgi:hypothetical protein
MPIRQPRTPEQRGPDEDIKADQEERLDQATEEIFW